MKKIHLIKNTSELGAGTRGASLGIDALEVASLNLESDYFNRYSMESVEVYNSALHKPVKSPAARHIQYIHKVYEHTAAAVKKTLDSNSFPIVLSGDHSSAGGTIAGVKMAYPDKKVGVIWVDAHGDLHSPYTSPSGNVHGMPLATALAEDNTENKVRTLDDETRNYWDKLKSVGAVTPKIEPEHLVFFGVRDTEAPEDALMKARGIKNYSVAEMRYRGFLNCLEEAKERLSNCDVLYISFDVDSMDCDLISKGTGTPVSKGFDQNEVVQIMQGFIETGKVVCLEVVEVNPTLDNKGNKMAETAFKVLDQLTNSIEEQLKGH